MPKAEYDFIASPYVKAAEERADRRYVLKPSAKHYVGDVKGLKVLDLACGSGIFSRMIKEWGAAEVTGVDLSAEMLGIAKAQEKVAPLGIRYLHGDVTKLGKLGEFDLVFAGFLLHYSENIEGLRAMCRSIAENLKPGGRFVSFNENPVYPTHEGIQYSVTAVALEPLRDGSKVRIAHVQEGREVFSFTHQHYEEATYNGALSDAGFTEISWPPFVKSPDADAEFPPHYWDAYLKNFSIAVLTAKKRG